MTITFTGQEWDEHIKAIDQWRYDRDLAMGEVLKERMGPQLAGDAFMHFNELIRNKNISLVSPIAGTKLNIK